MNPDQNANQIQIEMRTIFFSSGVGAREGRKHLDNSVGNKISDVSFSSRYIIIINIFCLTKSFSRLYVEEHSHVIF